MRMHKLRQTDIVTCFQTVLDAKILKIYHNHVLKVHHLRNLLKTKYSYILNINKSGQVYGRLTRFTGSRIITYFFENFNKFEIMIKKCPRLNFKSL